MASSQSITQAHSKEVVEIIVSEKDGSRSASPASEDADAWAPGVKRKMPWIGIGALFVVMLAALAQMTVLLVANGQSASQWPEFISPNVCLSILAGVASLALAFAVAQGVAIAWWRQALAGASIKQLHHTYNFSTSVTSIFKKYKYFNTIALTALMAKVAIVDSVLFQRSIQTYVDILLQDPKTDDATDVISTWAMSSFPLTAFYGSTNNTEGPINYYFSNTVGNWLSTGNGINTNFPQIWDCEGAACLFGINGTGFAVDCQSQNVTDNFVNTVANGNSTANKTIFSIDLSFNYPTAAKPYQWFGLNTTWPVTKDNGNKCPTVFTTATCELRPSLLNYTIFYVNASTVDKSARHKSQHSLTPATDSLSTTGGQLTYSCAKANETTLGATIFAGIGGYFKDPMCGVYDPQLKQVKGVEVIQSVDVNYSWTANAPSSLIGIFSTLQETFQTRAVMKYSAGDYSVTSTGLYASLMSQDGVPYETSYCNYTYFDPRSVVINQINSLMATLSVDANLWDSNVSTIIEDGQSYWNYNQQTRARQYYKDVFYKVDKRFMGAALGLTLVVIICILPSYWGFWQLGRDVTLGPMEIAYAFQGPAFQSVHGVNGNGDLVVKTIGSTKLQYGEIDDDGKTRLAFKMT